MLKNDYGIKRKPITVSPQANAIVERIHQVIGNIIRTFELQDNYLDERILGRNPKRRSFCSAINVSHNAAETQDN
jgi:hypothetical protein